MVKWIPSLLIVCLIEGDPATFVLERSREGNEHKQCLQGENAPRHLAALWEAQIPVLGKQWSRWNLLTAILLGGRCRGALPQ